MKHFFTLTTLVFLLGSGAATAQRNVTKFKDYSIEEGQYCNIGGQKRYEPDIYYTKSADGTYTAHRLTVQPNGERIKVSEPYLFSSRPNGISLGWKTSAQPKDVQVVWGEAEDKLDNTAQYSTTELASNNF